MNSIYDKLTTLDFVIVAGYLVALLVIGYVVSMKQRKKNETLFLAGNSLNWYSIGFNMWGTNVGPSSLLAFASIGYATGIVAGNFEWYAFVFLLLLAMVFAPRYIASKVSTMPEYMGKRYGDSTQTILAWYAMVKILDPLGVIVIIDCEHLCMSMRGVKKSHARTTTSAVRGVLLNPATRAEAISLITKA